MIASADAIVITESSVKLDSFVNNLNRLFFIGLRYFLVKRKDHFVSFISTVSMLGIALGVAVLITVLSVMNGFSKEIRAKILSITPHITLKSFSGTLNSWQVIVDDLKKINQVTGIAPYIAQHGLLAWSGYSKPVMVIGIDALQIENIYPLNNNVVTGSISELQPNRFNILLGQDLADSLGIQVNDTVALIIPQVNIRENIIRSNVTTTAIRKIYSVCIII